MSDKAKYRHQHNVEDLERYQAALAKLHEDLEPRTIALFEAWTAKSDAAEGWSDDPSGQLKRNHHGLIHRHERRAVAVVVRTSAYWVTVKLFNQGYDNPRLWRAAPSCRT